MINRRIFLCSIALTYLFSTTLPAQAVEQVGRLYDFWGPLHEIIIYNDHAYIAADWGGLQILDVSDPANIEDVGTIDGTFKYLGINDSVLIAASTRNSFLLGLSNPANPSELCISRFAFAQDDYYDASGNHFISSGYCADNYIFSSSSGYYQPDRPSEEGYFESSFSITDISNPENPVQVFSESSEREFCGAYDIKKMGDYLVGVSPRRLWIRDLSQIDSAVVIVERRDLSGSRLTIQDSIAYIASGNDEFLIAELSDLANITLLATIDFPSGAAGLVSTEEYLFIAHSRIGVVCMDITGDPGDPEVINQVSLEGIAVVDMTISNDKLYVILENRRFLIIDISNPADAYIIGSRQEEDEVGFVKLIDDIAVAGCSGNLYTVDISDLSNPVPIASIHVQGNIIDMQKYQDFIYLAKGEDGIDVIDVSNAEEPQIVHQIYVNGEVTKVIPENDYLYAVNYINQADNNACVLS